MMNSGDKLAGFVGQSMGGPKTKRTLVYTVTAAGSGQLPTVPFNCYADAYAFGAGGPASGSKSGAGGTAAFDRFGYGPGVVASYVVGAGKTQVSGVDGDPTTVTVSGNVTIVAQGGQSAANGGVGSVAASKGRLLRKGGDGGTSGISHAGDFGAAGGTASAGVAGGGGSGGFSDLIAAGPMVGGIGAGSTNANLAGPGGGGCSDSGGGSGTSCPGGLIVIFTEF